MQLHYWQQPLVPLALAAFTGCCLGAGILSGAAWIWLGAGGVFLAVSFFRLPKIPRGWILLAAFGTGFAGLAGLARQPSPNGIETWMPRREVELRGILADFGNSSPRGKDWSGILRCRTLAWHGQVVRVFGKVRFSMPGPRPEWNPGDELSLTGNLQALEGPANFGEFDLKTAWECQGIRGRLRGWYPEDCRRLEQASWTSWGRQAGELRRFFSRRLETVIAPPARAFVLAMLIGETEGLDLLAREDMSAAGVIHLISVSGVHAGLLCLVVMSLGRLFRLPGWLSGILAGSGLLMLVLISGGKIPVWRACLSTLCLGAAFLGGRPADAESSLAASALVLLAWNPLTCLDPGFQLTFAATFGILGAIPELKRLDERLPRPLSKMGGSLAVSVAASLAVAPLTIYHFHSVSVIGAVANLAAVPLGSALMGGGVLAAILGNEFSWLAQAVNQACQGAAFLFLRTLDLANAVPGGRWFGWVIPGAWVFAVYAGLLGLRIPRLRAPGLACLAVCAGIYFAWRPAPPRTGACRITFFSLGEGEAAYLESGDRKRILLDTGTETEFLWRVKPLLAGRGVQHLDALILSHFESDHAGGATACLKYFRVKQLICAQGPASNPRLWKSIRNESLRRSTFWRTVTQGEKVDIGKDVRLRILWPREGGRFKKNMGCLACRFAVPGGTFLAGGDATARVEGQWPGLAAVTVFKADHHGARDSNSAALLRRIHPALSVVMPGTRNPFGLPDPETLKRLRVYSGTIANTAETGGLDVTLNSAGPACWQNWKK